MEFGIFIFFTFHLNRYEMGTVRIQQEELMSSRTKNSLIVFLGKRRCFIW